MTTLTMFTLFPTLPIEIRLKMYAFNLQTPRVVTIECQRELLVPGGPRTAKSFTANVPPPPLLHVNQESRYEALAIYTPYCTGRPNPPIFLCMEQDSVRFEDGTLPYVPREVTSEIKRMVFKTKDCKSYISLDQKALPLPVLYIDVAQAHTSPPITWTSLRRCLPS
jgi:hypothetical protein